MIEVTEMLCYYTILKTNDTFHQEQVIDMFIEWLNNTKNKMEGLDYNHDLPFEYKIHHKHLIMKEFHEQHIFSIYFSTKDNYKHNHFIVEILFDKKNHELHLRFSKEMTNDSQYISSISIPTIFKTIIKSQYIKKETYALSDHAHEIDYQDIMNQSFDIPIVLMKTRIINAHQLAKELTGIAHVFYDTHQKEEKVVLIQYPHKTEKYKINRKKFDKVQIHEIAEKIRQYHIQTHKHKILSYELLYHQQLKNEHENLIYRTKEYQDTFQDEIARQQKEIDELKELYKMLSLEYQSLKEENALLLQKKSKHSDTALLRIDSYDKVEKYQAYLLQLIERSDQNLVETQIYRKSDIFQAILNANGGTQ